MASPVPAAAAPRAGARAGLPPSTSAAINAQGSPAGRVGSIDLGASSGILPSVPTVSTSCTQDLLTNGSFETGSENPWAPNNQAADMTTHTVVNNSSVAEEGSDYLDLKTNTAATSEAQTVSRSPSVGDNWVFSVWLKVGDTIPQGFSGSLDMWALGGTNPVESNSTNFTVGAGWTEVSVTLPIQYSGHTSLRGEIYLSTTNRDLYVDATQMKFSGLSNSGFEQGGTPPTGWTIYSPPSGTTFTTKSGSTAHEGGSYGQLSVTTAGGSVYQAESLSVPQGASFLSSIWVRSDDGTSISGQLNLFGIGGTTEQGDTAFTATSTWSLVAAPLDVQYSGHTYLQVQLYDNTPGHLLDVDAAELTNACIENASFGQPSGSYQKWVAASSTSMAAYQAGSRNGTYYSAFDGSWYGEFNIQQTGVGASIYQDYSGVTISPGQSWTFSAWVRSYDGQPLSGWVQMFGLGGTMETSQTNFTAGATGVGYGWTHISAPLDVQNTGHNDIRVEIYLNQTGRNLDVDGTTLASGNQAGLGPPGVPQSVTAVQSGNQASLGWLQNPDGGSATSWTIYPYLGSTLQSSYEQSSSASCTATGTPCSANFDLPGPWVGQSIGFAVAGTNTAGTGPANSPVTFTPVSPPTQVQAVGGNGLMNVTWATPVTGQSAITGYSVQAYNASTGAAVGSPVTVAGSATAAQITGLTNGTNYRATVAANTGSGSADASAASTSNVATAAAPAPMPSMTSHGYQDPYSDSFGGYPTTVVTADLRGKGVPDVVTTEGGGFAVLENTDGKGTLGAPIETAAVSGETSAAVAVGDVDGDGKLDVVTMSATTNSTPCTIAVYRGNGDGTFQAPVLTTISDCDAADSIALGDVRHTGKIDLVAGGRSHSANWGAYWFLTNAGSGTFTVGATNTVQATNDSGAFHDVQLVDLGNGQLDILGLAAGHTVNENAVVLYGHGDGTFGTETDLCIASGAIGQRSLNFITAGRLKASDSSLDVVADDGQFVYWWPGTGNGQLGQNPGCSPSTVTGVNATLGSVTEGWISDVNGDGISDIVMIGATSGPALGVYLGNGDGTFTGYDTSLTSTNPRGLALGDMNGDGKPDFVATEGGWPGNALTEDFLNTVNWAGLGYGGPLTGWDLIGDQPFCAPCALQHQQQQEASGSPITPATGAFFHTFTDIAIPSRLPFAVTRTYDSTMASVFGPFGWGWGSNLFMSLSSDPNSGIVTITQENGSTVAFVPSNGTYSPARDVPAALVKNGDGTWTFTRQGNQVYTFGSSGKLTKAQDLNAVNATTPYATSYAYNNTTGCPFSQSTCLSSVTDPGGRSLNVTWTGGVITQISDPAGSRSITYNYDSLYNLTSVVDIAGGTTAFTYDPTAATADHLLRTMRLPNCYAAGNSCDGGKGIQNTYDSLGRVTQQTDNLGRVTGYSYSASTNGLTVTITAPAVSPNCSSGCQTQEVYAGGLLQSVTYGLGTSSAATWQYQYDPRGVGVTKVTDPNGHSQTAAYDSRGNRLSATDALGHAWSWTYNSLNEPLTITDAMATPEVTTNTYDANGNLTDTKRPLQGTSPLQYEEIQYQHNDTSHPGDLSKTIDGDGKSWSYGYDGYGDLQTATDPLGNVTTDCFNSIGELIGTVTPKGAPYACANPLTANTYLTQYTYNARAQVLNTTDPLGHVTKNTYDADGNLLTFQDGNQSGNTCQTSGSNRECTAYTWDLDDEQTTVTRADGTTLITDFNADGTVADQKDGRGNTTLGYTYDPLQRVVTEKDGDLRSTTLTYDGVGNLKTLTDPAGQVTTDSYDNANRLTGITYSDGVTPNVSNVTYDNDNRRTGLTHGTATASWSWDSLGRLTGRTDENGVSLNYQYNFRNLVTAINYPGSLTVTRGYDDAGRWTSVSDWQNPANTVGFGYDANSNLTTETFPANGSGTQATDTFGFDAADRMMSVSDTTNAPSTLFSATYTRDSANQLTSDSSQPSSNGTYKYTVLNQLCNAGASGNTCTSGSPALPYSYDSADNLIGDNGVGQGFDAADQLCWSLAGATGSTSTSSTCPTTPTGATTYSYNSRGDRTGVTPSSGSGTTLGYDQANRLTSWTQGSTTASYTYSADGLRLSKTAGGMSNYLWDVSGGLPLLVKDGSTSFIYGPGGLPVEQVSSTGTLFYHHDQLGSTRLLTDANSVVQATYTYSPYGTTTSSTGTVTNPLQFAGQYLDATAGLYGMGARWYDPTTAQWLTRDPAIALTLSPYGYVEGSPLNGVDPSGLFLPTAAAAAAETAGTGVEVGIVGTATVAAAPAAAVVIALWPEDVGGPGDTLTPAQEDELTYGDAWVAANKSATAGDMCPHIVAAGTGPPSWWPEWAQRYPRLPAEDDEAYVTRILNTKYGKGNWKAGPGTEYNRIRKGLDRGTIKG